MRQFLLYLFAITGLLLGITEVRANKQATNQARADQIIELFSQGLVEDNSEALLNELKMLITAEDAERQKQLIRTQCWYQPSETTADINKAIAYADKHIQLYSDPYPSEILADLLLCRGWHKQSISDIDGALADLKQGIDSSYQLENPRLIADGRNIRGSMYSYQGNYSSALEDLITAQQLYESLHAPYWATYNLAELASTYRRFGDPTTALKYQIKLEKHYLDSGQRYDANELNIQIGYSMEKLGQYEEAISRFEKSYQFWLNNDDPILAEDIAISIAASAIKLGQYTTAKEKLLKAQKVIPDDYDSALSYLYLNLAYVAFFEQDYPLALKHSDKAIHFFTIGQNERGISESLKLKSDIHQAAQQWQQAFYQLSEYFKLHHQLDEKNLFNRIAEMQARFDTNKVKDENKLLIEATKAKEAQLQVMQRNEQMQLIIIVLSSIILLIVSVFAYKQLVKKRTFKQLALTDELTNLSNRRDTYNQGHRFLKQSKAMKQPFSVISFDADHFKQVNDTLGHEVGDKVLEKLAELSSAMMRDTDVVGRVGGEEFLILLPNIPQATAVEIAHRLVATIAQYNWSQISPELKQTVSAGVASLENETTLSPLLLRADKALYNAKAAGRNCVKVE